MSVEMMILVAALILLVGFLPAWTYSKAWGYRPAVVVFVLLVIFFVWLVAGGRSPFESSLGQDIRSAGKDVGNSQRQTVR